MLSMSMLFNLTSVLKLLVKKCKNGYVILRYGVIFVLCNLKSALRLLVRNKHIFIINCVLIKKCFLKVLINFLFSDC